MGRCLYCLWPLELKKICETEMVFALVWPARRVSDPQHPHHLHQSRRITGRLRCRHEANGGEDWGAPRHSTELRRCVDSMALLQRRLLAGFSGRHWAGISQRRPNISHLREEVLRWWYCDAVRFWIRCPAGSSITFTWPVSVSGRHTHFIRLMFVCPILAVAGCRSQSMPAGMVQKVSHL